MNLKCELALVNVFTQKGPEGTSDSEGGVEEGRLRRGRLGVPPKQIDGALGRAYDPTSFLERQEVRAPHVALVGFADSAC